GTGEVSDRGRRPPRLEIPPSPAQPRLSSGAEMNIEGSHEESKNRVKLSRRLVLMGPMATVIPTTLADHPATASPLFPEPRLIPARVWPAPDPVSQALQSFIAAPYPPDWDAFSASYSTGPVSSQTRSVSIRQVVDKW